MNIMIFNENVWSNHIASGNTLSNFFDGNAFKNDHFYNIYMRESIPDNDVCKNYYRMTLLDMIKNNFTKEKIGEKIIISNGSQKNNRKAFNERKYIDFIHKYSMKSIYNFANGVYRKKKWLNKSFKKYIEESKPDIFFAFLTNVSILKPICEYIHCNTRAKIVLYVADDIYDTYNSKKGITRKKLKKEFSEVVDIADKIYGITDELCNEYSKIFNKKIDLLYKGCTFEYPVKNNINNVIRFVYAGNLFYGRDEILSKVANAIDKNNSNNSQKAILEIYTGATITDELMKKLNIGNSSVIKGKKDYNEIKKIMNNAEYNLEVESFEHNQIKYVKYSFSTKIIDCLQSGSASIAIGPSVISSIKYMKKIPGVFVIESINDIETEIVKLINNKNEILKNAISTREYAINNHDINKNQAKIRQDFINLIKE